MTTQMRPSQDPLFPRSDRPTCTRCNERPVYMAGLCGACMALDARRPPLANAMTEAELVATRDMLDYRIGVLAIMAEPRVEGDWSKLELDKHRALRSRVLAAIRWYGQPARELDAAAAR